MRKLPYIAASVAAAMLSVAGCGSSGSPASQPSPVSSSCAPGALLAPDGSGCSSSGSSGIVPGSLPPTRTSDECAGAYAQAQLLTGCVLVSGHVVPWALTDSSGLLAVDTVDPAGQPHTWGECGSEYWPACAESADGSVLDAGSGSGGVIGDIPVPAPVPTADLDDLAIAVTP